MSKTILKPKKASLIEFTRKYSNNPTECFNFFFLMKYPAAFIVKNVDAYIFIQ